MYNIKLKLTKKNSEKHKEIRNYINEGLNSFDCVIGDGLQFLRDNRVPLKVIAFYSDNIEKDDTEDIDFVEPLKFRFYDKNIGGISYKLDVEISYTI